MRHAMRRLVDDERGEDLIEYALLVSFAAGISLAVIVSDPFGIKGALVDAYERAKEALDAV
jgi:Flp pilus assembly pilin Flp